MSKPGSERILRDPLWGDISFDASLSVLLGAREFLRLDKVRQLGPVAQVYPGATHTRLSHSLGVYHLAKKTMAALEERGMLPFATQEGRRSFLAASLFHDIGHFPYAHSLKELPLESHESMAGRAVQAEPLASLLGSAGADPAMVARIIDPKLPLDAGRGGEGETRFYRGLLSGVLDPDKVDYLTRDAFHCGVPYGIQDAEYIARRLSVEDGELVLDAKGAMSVDAVLFSKYQMYRAVYWHPAVRSATAAVKKAVSQGLDSGILEPRELYGLGDGEFEALLARRFPSSPLVRSAFFGQAFEEVASYPYDQANPRHRELSNLERRREAESLLASSCGAEGESVAIDIPEPIHFESELKVRGEEGGLVPFSQASVLFPGGKSAFLAASLRRIRLFAQRGSEGGRLAAAFEEFLMA